MTQALFLLLADIIKMMRKAKQIIIDTMRSPLQAAFQSNPPKNDDIQNKYSSNSSNENSIQTRDLRDIEIEATGEAIKEGSIEEKKAQEGPRLKHQALMEAKRDAKKETNREKKQAILRLRELSDTSDSVLCNVRSVIPILCDEVVVDTTKVTFIHRPFFFSERIHSVSIKNILDVYIDTAPFFATLNLVDAGFVENVVRIKWLWKKDAEKARRIITGLREASKESIDLKKIGGNMSNELEEIGKVRKINTSVSKG